MSPALLADLILYVHVAFVGFVVLSVPVILIGALRKWQFVRNPVFRITHCAAMVYVAVNTLLGIMCPLTIWENNLRHQAGQEGVGESFIAHWLSTLLFYQFPGWVFALVYTLFALLILAMFKLAPIRWKAPQSEK